MEDILNEIQNEYLKYIIIKLQKENFEKQKIENNQILIDDINLLLEYIIDIAYWNGEENTNKIENNLNKIVNPYRIIKNCDFIKYSEAQIVLNWIYDCIVCLADECKQNHYMVLNLINEELFINRINSLPSIINFIESFEVDKDILEYLDDKLKTFNLTREYLNANPNIELILKEIKAKIDNAKRQIECVSIDELTNKLNNL